jgi:hypothetical protein
VCISTFLHDHIKASLYTSQYSPTSPYVDVYIYIYIYIRIYIYIVVIITIKIPLPTSKNKACINTFLHDLMKASIDNSQDSLSSHYAEVSINIYKIIIIAIENTASYDEKQTMYNHLSR